MSPQAGSPASAEQLYRRLLAALAGRARRSGSRDPEAAAQETLKRALQNRGAKVAVEYYFSEELPPGAAIPEWRLDQLFAWLYGVLQNVVREERGRVRFQREVAMGEVPAARHPSDPAPGQLDALLQAEMERIVADCMPKLEPEYRRVLRMRAEGLTYSQIAGELGVNENTVATWISRGIRDLGRWLRKRLATGEAR